MHSLTSRQVSARTISSSRSIPGMLIQQQRAAHVCCVWTRPTPDRNEDWVKPSYVPQPQQQPLIQPREEPRPLYSPSAPEFRPAELPDKQTEMPEGPKMPERRPDPIPAGNPKERPSEGGGEETREAPPAPSPDKK